MAVGFRTMGDLVGIKYFIKFLKAAGLINKGKDGKESMD